MYIYQKLFTYIRYAAETEERPSISCLSNW